MPGCRPLRVGDRWAGITVLDCAQRKLTKTDRGVTETWMALFYKLRCECGKEWEIDSDEYRGRRTLRDCGCGCMTDARRHRGITGRPLRAALCVQLTLDQLEWLRDQSAEQNKSQGRVLGDAIEYLKSLGYPGGDSV